MVLFKLIRGDVDYALAALLHTVHCLMQSDTPCGATVTAKIIDIFGRAPAQIRLWLAVIYTISRQQDLLAIRLRASSQYLPVGADTSAVVEMRMLLFPPLVIILKPLF